MIKRIILIGFLFFKINLIFSQKIYLYPEKGFKRIDLILPKVKNPEKYKVEIKFGTELELSECSEIKNINISFENLKRKKGFDYHYYVLDIEGVIFQKANLLQTDKKCKSNKTLRKKLLSFGELFIDYENNVSIPFFIPENLTLEYRLWKMDSDFESLK
ncbi:ecotin family protein [Chryseobacterium gambrini]|uniref:ecotin family protein n=1 Tax=Chryseobacterium gambrini TaxID=373672 RepID=UPI0022F3BBB0|nr:ecotin family protein [Chryseobacterium gambrini]WBX96189.1 ecotin family protein [Chryseobacterium gambrini]